MSVDLGKLIVDVFDPQPGEQVFLLNDYPADIEIQSREIRNDYVGRRKMTKAWHTAFSLLGEERGFTVQPIISYQPTGANGMPLPEKAGQGEVEFRKTVNLTKIMSSWGKKDIVVAIARYSPTGPIFGLQKAGQMFRGATMPGATMDMSAFEADYKLVAEKATILADKLTNAAHASVLFSTGHEFYFDLGVGRQGHADDGQCSKPGQGINLPSGEAYICPYEGLDVELGESFTAGELPVMYGDELVIYKVEQGKIIKIIGEGPKAYEMKEFFEEDSGRRFIAELGLGCNDKATLCGKILQDEKIEGLHWAFGYNAYLGGDIDDSKFLSPDNLVHEDNIYAADADIGVTSIVLGDAHSDIEILRNGRYLPEVLGDAFNKS